MGATGKDCPTPAPTRARPAQRPGLPFPAPAIGPAPTVRTPVKGSAATASAEHRSVHAPGRPHRWRRQPERFGC